MQLVSLFMIVLGLYKDLLHNKRSNIWNCQSLPNERLLIIIDTSTEVIISKTPRSDSVELT